MFRTASRASLRCSARLARTNAPRPRYLSTAPPHQQSRSWRSSAVRWGIAIGGVYYYNTSTLFAEEPPAFVNQVAEDLEQRLPTLETYGPSSRKKEQNISATQALVEGEGSTDSVEDLEEEAAGQGAFNEETGEINWDCPCLGGMAYGPCGPEFREAFSCFVFSKEDPKGMECIDKFKNMQGCFREHPEIYQEELEEDEKYEQSLRDQEDDNDAPDGGDDTKDEAIKVATSLPEDSSSVAAAVKELEAEGETPPAEKVTAQSSSTKEPRTSPKRSTVAGEENEVSDKAVKSATASLLKEEEEVVPRAAHDATASKKEN